MARLLWMEKQVIGPSPRVGHAMAYDRARGRVVLFGGDAFGLDRFGDTWIWNGDVWREVDRRGPSPRAGHAMAFDSARQRVVLFGGHTASDLVADTWEWDGETWTQMDDRGPAARDGHALAYDAAREEVVLFGGATAATPLGDTWTWNGRSWMRQHDAGPSPRSGHGLTYDGRRQRAVLFGGVGASDPRGLGDTWEWAGARWALVANRGPDGCVGCAMVFRSDRAAIFGGMSTIADGSDRRLFGVTWEWDGERWTPMQDVGVGARSGHAMAFDSGRGVVVLFGGLRGFVQAPNPARLRGDTWEYADVPTDAAPVPAGRPVAIARVDAEPRLVRPGVEFTIVVKLAGAAPPGGQIATIESNLGPIGHLAFAPGQREGQLSYAFPHEIAGHVPLPFALEITVTPAVSGGARAKTRVTIER
ncbi:MAG TPA: hypothetical protein VFO19_23390 [Vicinamibacterales bacterium]|nr:hypothetical protein [Vicinamibacterales bacterium]